MPTEPKIRKLIEFSVDQNHRLKLIAEERKYKGKVMPVIRDAIDFFIEEKSKTSKKVQSPPP